MIYYFIPKRISVLLTPPISLNPHSRKVAISIAGFASLPGLPWRGQGAVPAAAPGRRVEPPPPRPAPPATCAAWTLRERGDSPRPAGRHGGGRENQAVQKPAAHEGEGEGGEGVPEGCGGAGSGGPGAAGPGRTHGGRALRAL